MHWKVRRHPSISAVPFRLGELPPIQDITDLTKRDKQVPLQLIRYTGRSSNGKRDEPPCREILGYPGMAFRFPTAERPDGRVTSCTGCQRVCLPEYAAVRIADGALCSARMPNRRFLEGHRVLVAVRRDRRCEAAQDAGAGIQGFPEQAEKAAALAEQFGRALRKAAMHVAPGLFVDAG